MKASHRHTDIPLIGLLNSTECTVEEIGRVLAQGSNPNCLSLVGENYDQSALMIAARMSDPRILKVLLEAGADPNFVARLGYTAMHTAASAEHVELLAKHGAIYPKPSYFDTTPLRSAYHFCDFPLTRCLISIGAPKSEIRVSRLHEIVINEVPLTLADIIERYEELEEKDVSNRTPLLLALESGQVQSARTLIESGASVNAKNHHGSTALHFAARSGSLEAVKLVLEQGIDVCAWDDYEHSALHESLHWEKGLANFGTGNSVVEYLVQCLSGREEYLRELDDALSACESPQIATWLLNLGANLNAMDSEQRRNLNPSSDIKVSLEMKRDEFLQAANPRFGSQNAEACSEPFWQQMIVTRETAFSYREGFEFHFPGSDQNSAGAGPIWCADRVGQSITWLEDGRCIEIAGQHKCGYESDFCIYNDVFVHEPGKLPQIYLYPREIFPPTDFHTATRVGDWIYIIGSIGYPEDRTLNDCPVYQLNIETLRIEQVTTTGKDPGRICRHRAILRGERYIEVSDGKLCANGIAYGTPSPPATFDTECHVWLDVENLESTNQEI